ncbi:MAG: oligosaccharide flippase family protein [Planctomycetes bacterium]|nr:oligosaccharide flippase family protein [Planctomycetota bacterium]
MQTTAKDTFWLLIGTGLTAGLGFLYSVYSARVLGPETYGDVAAAVALVLACQTALGPINGTVARFTAEYAARAELGRVRTLSREVTRRVALYGAGGMLLALAATSPLQRALQFSSSAPLAVAWMLVYLTLLISVARGVLRGLQRFRTYNGNTVGESLVRVVTGVAILECAPGATAALIPYALSLGAMLWFAARQLRPLLAGAAPQPVDGAAVKRFTVPMFVMMLTSAGFQHMDLLLVKHWFSAPEAGLYGAAVTLTRAVAVLVTPFNLVLLPLLTARHQQGAGTLAPLLRLSGAFVVLAGVPLVLVCLWPAGIMTLLYTSEYAAGAGVLPGLTVVRLLGHLCHMMALAGAALNDFRFLRAYLPALALQAALLGWRHESPAAVVTGMLAVQAATLLAMVLHLVLRRGRAGRKAET